MKNIFSKMQQLLLTAVLLIIGSCTSDFENINKNPNEVTDDQLQALNYKIGTNIKMLQSLVIPVEEHMYQFNESLSGGPNAGYIGATVDAWLTKFETFNPSADWRKWPFVNVISETYPPYRAIVNATDDPVAIAFAELLRVAIMHRVTDSYGPIPYSKIIEDKKESLKVAYDTQEVVYMNMFEELDKAIATFIDYSTMSADGFRRYDNVYYGNISQWAKYANSLKLRMAMRISLVAPDFARQKAEEAVAAGVITDNADNAAMHAAENRMTLIYNDWSDHRIGADIFNYMNGYNDPRREKMFLKNDQGNYVGIRIGIVPNSKARCVARYSNMQVTSSTPYLWMNAAEVTFLRAEGALRGWSMGGDARTLYEQAIRLSFAERGADGVDAYIADAVSRPVAYNDPFSLHSVATPQSTITIAWEDGDTEVVKERNLERIITQKWIAIFPLGVEAWSEYRRTGYPRLLPAVENKSGGSVDVHYGARRFQYPVEEYTENAENLQTAISLLNNESANGAGDVMGTRVWWDCRTLN